jgi:hypothetical protein
MNEYISKLENSIENLKNKQSKVYFFVQDTKGNASASIRYIYQMAMSLKNNGFNPIILHEKSDYVGVQNWLGEKYMSDLPHQVIEGNNLQVSPDDTLIIPELFGFIMPQVANLPCAKIVLCQNHDAIFETLQAGQTWNQFGFTKCITTSEKTKEYILSIMRSVSVDVVEPVISEVFTQSKFPQKPVICVLTREQRDTANLIKKFYVKFPQYRWIVFKDMRGVSEEEFANSLKESMLSVWIDDNSTFGTYPIESMNCGVPVLGKIPKLVPEWLNPDNGIWIQDEITYCDVIADFIQNWLEDNIAPKVYDEGFKTSSKFSNYSKFENSVINLFSSYSQIRLNNFEQELNKQKIENV